MKKLINKLIELNEVEVLSRLCKILADSDINQILEQISVIKRKIDIATNELENLSGSHPVIVKRRIFLTDFLEDSEIKIDKLKAKMSGNKFIVKKEQLEGPKLEKEGNGMPNGEPRPSEKEAPKRPENDGLLEGMPGDEGN